MRGASLCMPVKDTGGKLNVSAADARVPAVHQGEISQTLDKRA